MIYKSQQKYNNFNNNFFQLNKKITPQILYRLASAPTALKILAIIMHCSNKPGAVILKQKYIQNAIHRQRNNISKSLKLLKSLGLIAIYKMDTRNAYILNPNFIWQDKSNKKYAITNLITFKNSNKIRNNPKISKIFTHLRHISRPLSINDLKYLNRINNK